MILEQAKNLREYFNNDYLNQQIKLHTPKLFQKKKSKNKLDIFAKKKNIYEIIMTTLNHRIYVI